MISTEHHENVELQLLREENAKLKGQLKEYQMIGRDLRMDSLRLTALMDMGIAPTEVVDQIDAIRNRAQVDSHIVDSEGWYEVFRKWGYAL